jgi:2-[(L-alanin-3-ylcarbamoyl)methyl]-2-hydroxybutanedioate decarboxylase
VEYPPSARGAPAYDAAALPGPVLAAIAALDRPANAYLYDPSVAACQAATLRSALPSWVDVFYAVKANSFPPVVDALAAVVDGFEVASAAEAHQAREAAARAGRAHRAVASGPGKNEVLLRALVDAGIETVNVESRLELERVAAIGRERGIPVPVAVRVNPAGVEVCGALAMGGGATPFGVPEEDVPAILERARCDPGVDVAGFHVHAVSGNLDAAAHVAYVRWCLEWSTATAAAAGIELRLVDAGGGLGVAFGGGDPFDVDAFAGGVRDLRPPDGLRLAIEPGRWLVAECGWYVAEVVDVKHSRGTWFAVVRGGINQFMLPASWDIVHRFAVVPVDGWDVRADRPEVTHDLVTIVGELCTPEDVLARDVRVDRLRAGDVLVFPQAGSYGWEFALHHFLQHPVPPRLAVDIS